jgi:hypothetical protein
MRLQARALPRGGHEHMRDPQRLLRACACSSGSSHQRAPGASGRECGLPAAASARVVSIRNDGYATRRCRRPGKAASTSRSCAISCVRHALEGLSIGGGQVNVSQRWHAPSSPFTNHSYNPLAGTGRASRSAGRRRCARPPVRGRGAESAMGRSHDGIHRRQQRQALFAAIMDLDSRFIVGRALSSVLLTA